MTPSSTRCAAGGGLGRSPMPPLASCRCLLTYLPAEADAEGYGTLVLREGPALSGHALSWDASQLGRKEATPVQSGCESAPPPIPTVVSWSPNLLTSEVLSGMNPSGNKRPSRPTRSQARDGGFAANRHWGPAWDCSRGRRELSCSMASSGPHRLGCCCDVLPRHYLVDGGAVSMPRLPSEPPSRQDRASRVRSSC